MANFKKISILKQSYDQFFGFLPITHEPVLFKEVATDTFRLSNIFLTDNQSLNHFVLPRRSQS